MKLIRCYQCDQYVAETEQLCPHCGDDLTRFRNGNDLSAGGHLAAIKPPMRQTLTQLWKRFRVPLLLVLMAVVTLIFWYWCFLGVKYLGIAEEIPGLVMITALGIGSVIGYMLPYYIAKMRRHRQSVAIGVLCFFLGWTFLGWVVALVWAYTADVEKPTAA